MDEDDIYGGDIYGTSSYGQDFGGSRSYQQGNNVNAAEIQSLKQNLAEKEQQCAELEENLKAALTSTDQWKQALKSAFPSTVDPRALQDPTTASQELKRVRAIAEKPQNEDIGTLRQREAALQMQLAERNLENIELRRQAHTARQYADPNIAQVRQLLMDPAIQREFERLKAELEKSAKEVKGLQEELQAVQFSQESKAGRMLMAKCRALQDENEEMGKELAEGKVHQLERQVVLSKTYVEDMRARYLELEDHAHVLDSENEDLHQQVFMLTRQLRESEARSFVPPGRDRGVRPFNSGGKFGHSGGFPGPPSGGPSPHGGHHMGRYESGSPEAERKRGMSSRDDRFGSKRSR